MKCSFSNILNAGGIFLCILIIVLICRDYENNNPNKYVSIDNNTPRAFMGIPLNQPFDGVVRGTTKNIEINFYDEMSSTVFYVGNIKIDKHKGVIAIYYNSSSKRVSSIHISMDDISKKEVDDIIAIIRNEYPTLTRCSTRHLVGTKQLYLYRYISGHIYIKYYRDNGGTVVIHCDNTDNRYHYHGVHGRNKD